MTTEQTAETVHGKVDYETVTCDSCDQDVLPDEVEPFLIITDTKTAERHNHDHVERDTYKRWEAYNGDYREGHVCDNCRDDPAGWPDPSEFPAWFHRFWWASVGAGILVLNDLLGVVG